MGLRSTPLYTHFAPDERQFTWRYRVIILLNMWVAGEGQAEGESTGEKGNGRKGQGGPGGGDGGVIEGTGGAGRVEESSDFLYKLADTRSRHYLHTKARIITSHSRLAPPICYLFTSPSVLISSTLLRSSSLPPSIEIHSCTPQFASVLMQFCEYRSPVFSPHWEQENRIDCPAHSGSLARSARHASSM